MIDRFPERGEQALLRYGGGKTANSMLERILMEWFGFANNRKKTGVVLAFLGLAVFSGCHPGEKSGRLQAPSPSISVSVATPGILGESHEISVAGVVRGIHEADLTARVEGQVEQLPVRLGQKVARGQLLLTLSSQTYQARKIRSQAALDYARTNFDRIDRLFRNGSASRSEWDRAKQSLDVAMAEEQGAQAKLSWTRVVAPFPGRIARKMVRKGDVVLPGTPLLSVIDSARLQVVGHVPDNWSAALHPGLKVRFEVSGQEMTGRIRDLSPQSDPVAHTITVKVLLDKKLLPGGRSGLARKTGRRFVRMVGMYGKLFIPVRKEQALRIPVSGLIDHEGLQEVFVVKGGHAELRYVRAGRTVGGFVEILSGLAPDEEVVVQRPAGLVDGAPVSIAPNGPGK